MGGDCVCVSELADGEVYLHDESQVCHIVLLCLNKLLQYIPARTQITKDYCESRTLFGALQKNLLCIVVREIGSVIT